MGNNTPINIGEKEKLLLLAALLIQELQKIKDNPSFRGDLVRIRDLIRMLSDLATAV